MCQICKTCGKVEIRWLGGESKSLLQKLAPRAKQQLLAKTVKTIERFDVFGISKSRKSH